MIKKLLKENFTKEELINFIVANKIYEEFFMWLSMEKRKNERNRESDKFNKIRKL